MPATLGVVGAESVLLALGRGRSPSCESADLTFFVTPDLTDPGPIAASGPALVSSIPALAASSEVILLATGPADIVGALEGLAPFLSEDHIVVVSSAEVTLDHLRLALGPASALLRVVLDPDGVGDGALVASAEAGTAAETVERATRALACIGVLEIVPEDSLEAVCAVMSASKGCLATALAGIEDGAVKAGLPRDVARSFVRQTAMATALLLQDHPGSPADLKDQVASPGGTTIAGLAVLEDLGVRGAFIRAVEAAVRRAREARDAEQSHVVE